MNAEKFFETHSIEEISNKTKISPISLRLIRNKEFEKIPRVKFIGFINILQKTYKVDLSDLIEEYNQFANINNKEKIEKEEIKTSNNSTLFLSFLSFILLILGGYLFYSYIKSNNHSIKTPKENTQILNKEINQTITIENNTSKEKNQSQIIIPNENNSTQLKVENNSTQIEVPKTNKETNTTKPKLYSITIIPKEKLWFNALNIDTNTSTQYLTSYPKILPKGNYYIKFGHGNETIIYNDFNITPNTRKIVRILFKDGNYSYLKKPNRYEK